MIGFYDYTLILTLGSCISAVIGIAMASMGHIGKAVLCLIISGICDGLDGKVARTKKNRSDDEKSFGVQLDSMCDMMAFCALPAATMMKILAYSPLSIAAAAFYGVCSVIRLSYYNMKEINRMNMKEPSEKVYFGLPITSSAMILPTTYILETLVFRELKPVSFAVIFFITGLCFVLNFRIRRPGRVVKAGLIAFVVLFLLALFVFSGFSGSGMGLFAFLRDAFSAVP